MENQVTTGKVNMTIYMGDNHWCHKNRFGKKHEQTAAAA